MRPHWWGPGLTGFSVLKKRPQGAHLGSEEAMWGQSEDAEAEPQSAGQEEPPPGAEYAGPFILNLPASRTMQNKCLLCKLLSMWCFVRAALADGYIICIKAIRQSPKIWYSQLYSFLELCFTPRNKTRKAWWIGFLMAWTMSLNTGTPSRMEPNIQIFWVKFPLFMHCWICSLSRNLSLGFNSTRPLQQLHRSTHFFKVC